MAVILPSQYSINKIINQSDKCPSERTFQFPILLEFPFSKIDMCYSRSTGFISGALWTC